MKTNIAASPYPWLASLAFALLWLGFYWRKGPRNYHVAAVCASMAIDLCLVLVLEFTKDAVATAISLSLNGFQQVHIFASTMAIVFYVPVFVLGWIRWKRPGSGIHLKEWHRRLGYCALFFRTIGFLFMFSIIGRTP